MNSHVASPVSYTHLDVYKRQVDYQTKEPVRLQIQGRHDPAILHRARVVIDSVTALGLLDLCCTNQAYQGMKKGECRCV